MKQELALARPRGKIGVLIVAGAGPDSVGDWMASVIRSQADMAFNGLVRNLSQLGDYLRQLPPDVILVDISSGILEMGDVVADLIRRSSRSAIIVVALPAEVKEVQKAMLSGASLVLFKPFSEAELVMAVRKGWEAIKDKDVLPPPPPPPTGEPSPRARILAVYSPKGGVGCTTLAVNLAVALKRETGQPVTLVDGDLRFGDVDTALNIVAGPSIAAIAGKLEEVDDLLLEQTLAPHPSGVKVLSAPPYLEGADAITPDAFRDLLERLAGLSPGYLVIDTWSTLDDITLAIVDACDVLIVVTTAQMTALRDTHRFLEALALLQYDAQKIVLVANHPYQPSTLRAGDLERAIGRAVLQEIPHAPGQVAASLNRGTPLVLEFPDSPATKEIMKLARYLSRPEAFERTPERRPPTSRTAQPKRPFSWGQAKATRG